MSLARKAGLPTPTYNAMIYLASVVNDTDFYARGRTLQNLGMGDWSLNAFETYLQTGARPA